MHADMFLTQSWNRRTALHTRVIGKLHSAPLQSIGSRYFGLYACAVHLEQAGTTRGGAHMEATAEGLAKAAATREALKKKKRELELVRKTASWMAWAVVGFVTLTQDGHLSTPPCDAPLPSQIEDGPPSKKQTGAAPSAVCTHEVACPKGFDPSSITLDPELYGVKGAEGRAGN